MTNIHFDLLDLDPTTPVAVTLFDTAAAARAYYTERRRLGIAAHLTSVCAHATPHEWEQSKRLVWWELPPGLDDD